MTIAAYDYEALPHRTADWLEHIARQVARVADQQVQVDVDNMSWWDTEEGIHLQEAWENVKRHEEGGDVQRFSTSLLILSRLAKKMHDMVEKEAHEVRRREDRDRESEPPTSHVRTKRKDTSPRSLDQTMAV